MKLAIAILILFLTASCKPKTEEVDLSSIVGTWNLKPSCKQSATSGYISMQLVYSEASFAQTVSVYSDLNCSVPILTIAISGTYITSNLTSTMLEYRADLDSTLAVYQITPNSSGLATDYNTSSYCGYNNWQLNVPKDVTGRNCDGTIIPSVGAVEYSFFEKVKVGYTMLGTEFAPDDLYFGTKDSTHDGTSPTQRYAVGYVAYIFSR